MSVVPTIDLYMFGYIHVGLMVPTIDLYMYWLYRYIHVDIGYIGLWFQPYIWRVCNMINNISLAKRLCENYGVFCVFSIFGRSVPSIKESKSVTSN